MSIIITCAITGGDDTAGRFPAVPVSPKQIAESAVQACEAGAAIAHIHVRNPETGKPSIELELYREVVARIRDAGSPVIINLTTGAGARFLPSNVEPNHAGEGSNLRTPTERFRHVVSLKPDICSLDMGSLNFGRGALVNVPYQIEIIAKAISEAGVKPELEVFDTGHIALAKNMIEKGLIDPSPLWQIVLGVPWGAPAEVGVLQTMQALLPSGSTWAAFGIGKHEFPVLAQTALLGGHVRVGLEDNLYISRGVPAKSNTQLVEKAVSIMRSLEFEPATPDQARVALGLPRSH